MIFAKTLLITRWRIKKKRIFKEGEIKQIMIDSANPYLSLASRVLHRKMVRMYVAQYETLHQDNKFHDIAGATITFV